MRENLQAPPVFTRERVHVAGGRQETFVQDPGYSSKTEEPSGPLIPSAAERPLSCLHNS